MLVVVVIIAVVVLIGMKSVCDAITKIILDYFIK
jgi:hypothetical protein